MDNKIVDHAVKNQAIIKSRFDLIHKVVPMERGFVVEFQNHIAGIGHDQHMIAAIVQGDLFPGLRQCRFFLWIQLTEVPRR